MRPTPEQLAEVPLFESLSADQLKAVATLSELRQEDAGAILVDEGAPGYSLFVIQSGSASVTSGDKILTALGPGDFFGEIALLGDRYAHRNGDGLLGDQSDRHTRQRLPCFRALLSGSVRIDETCDGRATGTIATGVSL
jgi:Cyclic nucleotide-binding domain